MVTFGPFMTNSGPYMVWDNPHWSLSMHFILVINVALTKFDLKWISEAGGHPDGQFWAISFHFRPFLATYMVRDGPDCASIVHFFSENQCCFNNICPKIDIWGWSWSRWPILDHFRPFPAISGHAHGPRWSRISFKHLFFSGNQCCFNNMCPKIDIWGCRCSRWPSFGRSRPPRGPRRSPPKQKIIRISFRSHL